jgi:ABC-type transport system involved in cytochrome bd biosynthesis fused ATPase/permease subunit
VAAFIFTLYIQDFAFLTRIFEHIRSFKFITFFGLMLMVTDIIWTWIGNRETRKENAALKHELNTLKAKLFDMQESSKQQEAAKNTPNIK